MVSTVHGVMEMQKFMFCFENDWIGQNLYKEWKPKPKTENVSMGKPSVKISGLISQHSHWPPIAYDMEC